jgi:hypothetical protein
VDEHDEPIVVDNFPVRIDFGEGHPTTPGTGPSWKRDFTNAFHQVVAIFEDQSGGRMRHRVKPAGGSQITFDLVRESDPQKKVKLTFTLVGGIDGRFEAVMTPENETFVIESSQRGRLKPENLADLRLTKVTTSKGPLNLKPGGVFGKKVTVVIVGAPETKRT